MNLESFDSYEKNIIQKAIDKGLPIEKYLNPKFSIWTIKYLIAVLEEDDNLEDFSHLISTMTNRFKSFCIVFIEVRNGRVGLSQI